ncbi:hypothetical protein HDU89_001114 [Geranomyces variabilis]|nr:hypothetical protein HDU89_001114 [Geranomyces variabilis]
MLRRWNDDLAAVCETEKGRLEGTEVTILKKYAWFYAYVGEELKSFRLLLSPTQLAHAREHHAVLRFVQDGSVSEDEGGPRFADGLARSATLGDPDEEVVIPYTPEKAHLKVAPIDEADAIYIFKPWFNRRAINVVRHH